MAVQHDANGFVLNCSHIFKRDQFALFLRDTQADQFRLCRRDIRINLASCNASLWSPQPANVTEPAIIQIEVSIWQSCNNILINKLLNALAR